MKAAFESTFDGKGDLLYYFLDQAIEVTSRLGLIGMITSRYWLEAEFAGKLRRQIGSTTNVAEIFDFGELTVFPGVGTKTCLVILKKQKSQTDAKIVKLTSRINEFGQECLESAVASGLWRTHEAFSRFQIPQTDFATENWRLSPEATSDITKRIDQISTKLDEFCFCNQGIVTGCDRAFVLNAHEVKEKGIESSLLVPWVKVGDLNRYNLDPVEQRFLIYANHLSSIEEYPKAKAHISQYMSQLMDRRECKAGKIAYFHLQWGRDRKLFSKEKLICRFKAQRNTFVLDNLPAFSSADTTLVIPKASCVYELNYLLALLNSRLLTFYFSTYGKLMDYRYEYYPGPVSNLPIRRIEFTTPESERKRLTTKARALYESGLSTKSAYILDVVEKELAANHADVIHDLLVFLAEQMTELNQQKQTAAKKFLTDLKDFQDIDVHALKPKTKLDEFWKLDTAALFAHFYANKRRLKAPDEEKIRDRFQKSKEQLIPLETQIRFIDELIDQIVYRLYGLTEDEIKIVEGRAS